MSQSKLLQGVCIGAAVLMGLAAEANRLFMLVSPEHWYFSVPGVTTTGPFNQHFIRDIGLIFLFVGMFWAIFHQIGSTWVEQAKRMDRTLFAWERMDGAVLRRRATTPTNASTASSKRRI